MRHHLFLITSAIFICLSASFASANGESNSAQAGSSIMPSTTYSLTRDYRRCAAPYCGGWWATPVNQFDGSQIYQQGNVDYSIDEEDRIYITDVNFGLMGLSQDENSQIIEMMDQQKVLVKGTFRVNEIQPDQHEQEFELMLNLRAEQAWVSVNDDPGYGMYMNVGSTGIVCFTTPCLYYRSEIINHHITEAFHDLDFLPTLTAGQEVNAWRYVAQGNLIVMGTRGFYQGHSGIGVNVSASKLFFPYPDSVRQQQNQQQQQ